MRDLPDGWSASDSSKSPEVTELYTHVRQRRNYDVVVLAVWRNRNEGIWTGAVSINGKRVAECEGLFTFEAAVYFCEFNHDGN